MTIKRPERNLIQKFAAAFRSNPTTMLVTCWLALAYLIPILFLPWVLITYALQSLGIPLIVCIPTAAIAALIGLRIHMQWRN